MVGPHFSPIGLAMPRQNSTWAPSSWRVRSPIQSEVGASCRTSGPRSNIDAGHRLLEAEQQRLVAGEELGRA